MRLTAQSGPCDGRDRGRSEFTPFLLAARYAASADTLCIVLPRRKRAPVRRRHARWSAFLAVAQAEPARPRGAAVCEPVVAAHSSSPGELNVPLAPLISARDAVRPSTYRQLVSGRAGRFWSLRAASATPRLRRDAPRRRGPELARAGCAGRDLRRGAAARGGRRGAAGNHRRTMGPRSPRAGRPLGVRCGAAQATPRWWRAIVSRPGRGPSPAVFVASKCFRI